MFGIYVTNAVNACLDFLRTAGDHSGYKLRISFEYNHETYLAHILCALYLPCSEKQKRSWVSGERIINKGLSAIMHENLRISAVVRLFSRYINRLAINCSKRYHWTKKRKVLLYSETLCVLNNPETWQNTSCEAFASSYKTAMQLQPHTCACFVSSGQRAAWNGNQSRHRLWLHCSRKST